MGLAQNVVFGLVTGSYIAVAAVGFTLIYGINDMINFAYGEYMTIGAYVGLLVGFFLPAGPVVSILLVVAVSAVAGWLVARVFFIPIKDTGPVPLLLTSIGVGYILRYLIQGIAGPDLRFFEFQQSQTFRTEALGGVFVNTNQLTIIGIAILVFGVTHLLLTRTDVGLAMRALSKNNDLARVSGVPIDNIQRYVWLLASGLAGLSGYLIGIQRAASPFVGFNQILIVLTAAILGGAGSAYGAIAGSYIIGVVMATSVGVLPSWATELSTAVAFAVLIVVLLVRPGGIASAEVREA